MLVGPRPVPYPDVRGQHLHLRAPSSCRTGLLAGVGGVPSWGWWVPGKGGRSVEVVVGSYLVSAMLPSPSVAVVVLVFTVIASLCHPWLVPLRRLSGCRCHMWVVSSSPHRGKIVKT